MEEEKRGSLEKVPKWQSSGKKDSTKGGHGNGARREPTLEREGGKQNMRGKGS